MRDKEEGRDLAVMVARLYAWFRFIVGLKALFIGLVGTLRAIDHHGISGSFARKTWCCDWANIMARQGRIGPAGFAAADCLREGWVSYFRRRLFWTWKVSGVVLVPGLLRRIWQR